ncbi:Uncharacterised protein [BD1-7 clade bacterium]|uniref:Uncharacterized protein n=1 Tax=BD1-7 clade bacterium TaxID=2029982 RepID=A0A5S9PY97_9GAMM|nr:Uncharacterised protein [BD1-7 clade bacterium]
MKLSSLNFLFILAIVSVAQYSHADPINKDVAQWLFWSAADKDKYEIPVITDQVADALTEVNGENRVYVKTKNSPPDTELYIQVNPWAAYNNFQQGPPVSLPPSSEFVEVTYQSDTSILWQARQGDPENPDDCVHGYQHPVTTLPASPDQLTTQRVYWSAFKNPYQDDAPLDTTSVCKFNFVMLSPPSGSELTITGLYIDQYDPADDVPCERLGNCKIDLTIENPHQDIYRTYGEATHVDVRAKPNEADSLKRVVLKVTDVNGYPTGMGGPMNKTDDDHYEAVIYAGFYDDIKYMSVEAIDTLGNVQHSKSTKITTDAFTYTGVSAWRNWRAYGPSLVTPETEKSALTEDDEGNAIVTVIGEGTADVELIQHVNPYAILENGRGGPMDLTPFNSSWVQVTYQSDTPVELQLREGLGEDDCVHGYGQNKVFLPESPDRFSTVRAQFSDFKPHGGQDPDHKLDLTNVCKFNFYIRGGTLSIKDMTIENYDPSVMRP